MNDGYEIYDLVEYSQAVMTLKMCGYSTHIIGSEDQPNPIGVTKYRWDKIVESGCYVFRSPIGKLDGYEIISTKTSDSFYMVSDLFDVLLTKRENSDV